MTTQANDWRLETYGDGWSGVSRIVDAHGLIVAAGPEHHMKRLLREHEQYEPLREALRKAVEALEAVIRFNDAFPGEVEVALARCREVLGEE